MDSSFSPRARHLAARLSTFMDAHIYPNEAKLDDEIAQGDRWEPPALMEELKRKAQAEGLWNLFLPPGEHGAGLYCWMVRGFDGPRAVSAPPQLRRAARNGDPTARAGRRVVGFAVRGKALGG